MSEDQNARGLLTAAEMKATIGPRIKHCIKCSGLGTQKNLANVAGLTEDVVSNLCRGLSSPSPYDLMRLCDVLGVTADYLLFGRTHNLSPESYSRYVAPEDRPSQRPRKTRKKS